VDVVEAMIDCVLDDLTTGTADSVTAETDDVAAAVDYVEPMVDSSVDDSDDGDYVCDLNAIPSTQNYYVTSDVEASASEEILDTDVMMEVDYFASNDNTDGDGDDEAATATGCPGFALVWDNTQKLVQARQQSRDSKNRMLLWANAYAALNRVDVRGVADQS